MINLEPKYLEMVRKILSEYIPNAEVRVFGSRITEKARQFSDLDIVVVGAKRMDLRVFAALKEAFVESDLPFRVDILDWQGISESFRKNIEERYEVLQYSAEH